MSDEVTNDLAEFDAGFTDDAPTPTPEAVEEPAEKTPEVVTQKYAQITEEQFAELVKKADALEQFKTDAARRFDNAFGQLGGMKQVMERLQAQTPAGQQVQVSADDFAELKAEFPELADMQIKGLNRALSKARGTAPAVDNAVIERIMRESAETRADALDSLHNIIPDWQQAINKPEFANWLGQQSDDIKQKFGSDKVRDAAAVLRAYSRYQPVKPEQQQAKAPAVSTRQRQLEAAAVTPKSAGRQAVTASEDDEFDRGFYGR